MAAASVPVDYTNKDYASLRQALLELARYRLPEWTDRSPADLGVLLVDLFSYMGDVVLYYQDRIAAESFLHTASERRSVMHLLRLLAYELAPPAPASADLRITFRPPTGSPVVTLANGTQFSARGAAGELLFEYLGPTFTIDLNSDQVQVIAGGKRVYDGLPVTQSASGASEILGSSTGEPNLSFPLARSPLILDSLVVEVNEGGAGWVRWDRRESLLYNDSGDGRPSLSTPESRHYYVQFDEEDRASVRFGDGVYGRRPPAGVNNLRATYRVGGGAAGNVPAGAISRVRSSGLAQWVDSVTNLLPAAGGTDHESLADAIRFGPLAFRSGQRAVTLDDYVVQAHRAGGVAKVRARSRGWNVVELYVAPEGTTVRPVPEDLRRRLIAYFEAKRMAGTFVDVLDATFVPIDLSADVVFDRHFHGDAVRQAVEAAVRDVLAFDNVDFGQSIYLSDLYARIEAVPGVQAVTLTRFLRHEARTEDLDVKLREASLPPLDQLPEFVRKGLLVDVVPDGRIDVGEFEIAGLGELKVRMQEAVR
ncbi:putative baseplate assembly protein [Corallococcus coralloides]|uniref:putative baseplate assembly protein n=1 Tax=Corallococcus coralloides TaxID=184914 RepID=UPI00384B5828